MAEESTFSFLSMPKGIRHKRQTGDRGDIRRCALFRLTYQGRQSATHAARPQTDSRPDRQGSGDFVEIELLMAANRESSMSPVSSRLRWNATAGPDL